jgi:hypothetical protein
MKGRAIALAKQGTESKEGAQPQTTPCRSKVDKSVLTISEPKRIQGAFALRGAATLSHLREIAEPRPPYSLRPIQRPWAQGQRRIHCTAMRHSPSAEPAVSGWWQEHKIDLLTVAERMWRESTKRTLPGEDVSAVEAK